MLTRRAALLGPILGPVVAPVVVTAARAADPDAVAPIQALNAALLSAMRSGKATPFAQRYAALAPVVERAFDLPTILRVSVGLLWSALQPTEQQQLLDAFRKFTVCSYAANFDSYSNEHIDIIPQSRTIGPDQVVATQITGSGDPARIDYVMHRAADGWRAIDVLLNGSISQVAVNRSDWGSLLRGRAAAPLIASLQKKVADLSGGTVR